MDERHTAHYCTNKNPTDCEKGFGAYCEARTDCTEPNLDGITRKAAFMPQKKYDNKVHITKKIPPLSVTVLPVVG